MARCYLVYSTDTLDQAEMFDVSNEAGIDEHYSPDVTDVEEWT